MNLIYYFITVSYIWVKLPTGYSEPVGSLKISQQENWSQNINTWSRHTVFFFHTVVEKKNNNLRVNNILILYPGAGWTYFEFQENMLEAICVMVFHKMLLLFP